MVVRPLTPAIEGNRATLIGEFLRVVPPPENNINLNNIINFNNIINNILLIILLI